MQLWSSTAKRTADGALEVGGVDVRELVAEHGSPAYLLDEADFRARARAFKRRFQGLRRLLRRQGVPLHDGGPLGDGGGTQPRHLHGGELAVALRAGAIPKRLGFHGNNKSESELARALDAGVGRIIVDSLPRSTG